MRTFHHVLIISWLFVLGPVADAAYVPEDVPYTAESTIFVTWQDDPCTTMTVQWLDQEPLPLLPGIEIRSTGAAKWTQATAVITQLPKTDIKLGRVHLTGLLPDTEYTFRLSGGTENFKFKTMPQQLTTPLHFVSGGDAYATETTVLISDQAAKTEPLFAVLGGDITYDQGGMSDRVINFIKLWHAHMITPSGRLIPLISAIGNHEVHGGYFGDYADAPFFYTLFAIFEPRGAYTVLDFGDYMSIILLDTVHTAEVDGPQTSWLEKTLEARKDRPHLFVVYHLPAYPSHNEPNHLAAPRIRGYWVPLFERYDVDVVFEHHDHTYKRTHRIRDRKVDPTGVLYLGDGGWGKSSRKPVPATARWYLARTLKSFHFIETTLEGSCRAHRAIDENGKVIDSVSPDEPCESELSHSQK